MMRIIRILFPSLVAFFLFSSCYRDLSTEADDPIPTISIRVDGAEGDTITIAYGDTLNLTAVIRQQGYSSADLAISWTFDLQPNYTSSRYEIGDEAALSFEVMALPSTTPYYLALTVTNKQNSYVQMKYWPVYVTNPYLDGLLVAHTRDGGVTSDLDLINDTPLTYGYDSDAAPTIRRNIYSYNNSGETLPGKVTAMVVRYATDMNAANVSSYNDHFIAVGTEDHIYGINPTTFEVNRQDSDMFLNPIPSSFGVKTLFDVAGYSSAVILSDGTLYGCLDLLDIQYQKVSYPYDNSAVFGVENIAYRRPTQGQLFGFDPIMHDFHSMTPSLGFGGSFDKIDFNPGIDLSMAECIAAGGNRNDGYSFVLKVPGPQYYVITLYNYSSFSFILREVNLPEVENAVSFTFCDNGDLFYYATPQKVYSVVAAGSQTLTTELTWHPDRSSERITMVRQYVQGWMGISGYSEGGYAMTIPTNQTQLIIVTYNPSSKEGKVYLRPFNVSTGAFTAKSNGVYGGFGEITALASTVR